VSLDRGQPSSSLSGVHRRAIALLSALLICGGCDGADPIDPPKDGGIGASAAGGVDGGDAGAGGAGGGAVPDAGDAGTAAVLIGLTPNPRSDAAEPSEAERVQAELIAFAAGVRALGAARPWRSLDAAGLDALGAKSAFYADHGRRMLLELLVIDRAADERPAELVGLAWDDPAVVAALDATIDAVLSRVGAELTALTFGREVDVYLAAHEDQRGSFEALAAHALGYARTHPMSPAGLRVGVGFSFSATMGTDPSLSAVLAAADVLAVSYLPEVRGSAEPANAVVGDMDALIARAAQLPIALTALGVSSAPEAGGSPAAQRDFYHAFYQALEPRRASFPLVNAFELFDLSPEACAAHVAAQGEEPDGSFARHRCTLGLHGADGAAKAAWPELIEAAATFASP
jgi:hypothetical protein